MIPYFSQWHRFECYLGYRDIALQRAFPFKTFHSSFLVRSQDIMHYRFEPCNLFTSSNTGNLDKLPFERASRRATGRKFLELGHLTYGGVVIVFPNVCATSFPSSSRIIMSIGKRAVSQMLEAGIAICSRQALHLRILNCTRVRSISWIPQAHHSPSKGSRMLSLGAGHLQTQSRPLLPRGAASAKYLFASLSSFPIPYSHVRRLNISPTRPIDDMSPTARLTNSRTIARISNFRNASFRVLQCQSLPIMHGA